MRKKKFFSLRQDRVETPPPDATPQHDPWTESRDCLGMSQTPPMPHSFPTFREPETPEQLANRARKARTQAESIEDDVVELSAVSIKDVLHEVRLKSRYIHNQMTDEEKQAYRALPASGLTPTQIATVRMGYTTAWQRVARLSEEARFNGAEPDDPRYTAIGKSLAHGDMPKMWEHLIDFCNDRGYWVPLRKYKPEVLAYDKEMYDMPDSFWEAASTWHPERRVLDGELIFDAVEGPIYFDAHCDAIRRALDGWIMKRINRDNRELQRKIRAAEDEKRWEGYPEKFKREFRRSFRRTYRSEYGYEDDGEGPEGFSTTKAQRHQASSAEASSTSVSPGQPAAKDSRREMGSRDGVTGDGQGGAGVKAHVTANHSGSHNGKDWMPACAGMTEQAGTPAPQSGAPSHSGESRNPAPVDGSKLHHQDSKPPP